MAEDTVHELMIRAANEFSIVRRRLLPANGIRPSVCNAKRCLDALKRGSIDIAIRYLTYAELRDPGEWDEFAKLVRASVAAKCDDSSADT